MKPSFFNPATGLPAAIRLSQRLHLKHSTHPHNGAVVALDGTGFVVAFDSTDRKPGEPRSRFHYNYSQADAFVLGNRPFTQDSE